MEQVPVNAASQVFISTPAGYLSKSVAGAVDVTLTAEEASADFIELTGAITADINVIVPVPAFPQVQAGQTSFKTLPTWIKYFGNLTTGAHTLTIKSTSGTGSALAGNGSNTYGLRAYNGTNVVGATAG